MCNSKGGEDKMRKWPSETSLHVSGVASTTNNVQIIKLFIMNKFNGFQSKNHTGHTGIPLFSNKQLQWA